MTTLQSYYDLLSRHDWYYTFSDDGSVYRAGAASEANLRKIADESPEHRALFEGFAKHYFSGSAWGNERQPLPARPV